MFAKGEHQFCGLDKLGVTGSSPVPPIIDRSPLRLAPQHDDFGRFLAARRREPTPAKPSSAALWTLIHTDGTLSS